MAVYIVTMMKKLVNGEDGVDGSGLYTKEMTINKPHCAETLEEVMDTFEESFLSTQFAKDGWVLAGNATVTVLTKKFYQDHYTYLDDDLSPQKTKSHLTLVK